jgi:hypothetical protein
MLRKKNGVRRNRAQRKILNCKHLDIEIRTAIAVIIDHLSHKSDYCLAWPSAQHIANKLGRCRRSAQWYIKIIKRLEIFTWQQLSPDDAVEYVRQKYGFRINLDRCNRQAPNLFEVNDDHSLWNSKGIPKDLDKEMGAIARAVKEQRNRKTTSRLSSNPNKLPHSQTKYDVVKIRQQILRHQSRCQNGDANFTTNGDANFTQVLELSFADSTNETPNAWPALPVISSPKDLPQADLCPIGSDTIDTPPAHHLARGPG